MQKEFGRSISQLDNLFSYIAEFTNQNQIGPNDKNVIYLAVEEIFTNMVKYNPEASSKIILELYCKDTEAIVSERESLIERYITVSGSAKSRKS